MIKVYDCFLFSYNPDILEIRLNILDEVVDQFVIVEADYNWNGMYKGFVFTKEENLKKIEKFLHKITYVQVKDMPQHQILEFSNAEAAAETLEIFNRNAIARGLVNVKNDDIIIASDFDEIPRPEILKQIKKEKNKDVILLSMPNFFYRINSIAPAIDKKLTNSVIFNKKMLEKHSVHELRWNFRQALLENKKDFKGTEFDVIYNSGWHFSWAGDSSFINEKLDGYLHQEYRDEKGRKHIEEEAKMRDLHPECGATVNILIDSFLPDYIVKNQEKYSYLISKNVILFCPFK
jgi:beta-1,4-mannosyl-glycoprotein beta-1,4-N-acetylglucosaminyltransferase